ncbi:hypothetical protein AB0I35_06460 [Nocardia sp. NPDC050378]|uniref:hypothetical protein n=1 Tax=Nocardia sp. NPDC050378 TaxID=3155400 RepID=UPI0033E5117E
MSTAISALRSHDPAEVPEPVLRRRRTARAPRPFRLVRGSARAAVARPGVPARFIPHPPRPSAPVETIGDARGGDAARDPRVAVRGARVAGAVRVSRGVDGSPGVEPRARGARTFDITVAEVDLAFATVPRWDARPPRSVTRDGAGEASVRVSTIDAPTRRVRADVRSSDRGPGFRGPRRAATLYGELHGSVARGVHPTVRVRRAQAGLAALALTALVTALVVATLLGLAHLRAGSLGGWTEPSPGISQPGDHPQVGLFETRPQN